MATISLVTQLEFAKKMDVGFQKNQVAKEYNVRPLKNLLILKLLSSRKIATKIS